MVMAMGWSSILRGFGRFGSSFSKSFSSWLSATKLSSWLKVGAAGGVGVVIYSGWTSAIRSISDATGLSEGNVETVVFLILGCLVVYVAVTLIRPKGSDSDVTVYVPRNDVPYDRLSSRSSGRGSGSNRTGSNRSVSYHSGSDRSGSSRRRSG